MGGWQSRSEDPEPWRVWSAVGSVVFAAAFLVEFLSVPGIIGHGYAGIIKQAFTAALGALFGVAAYRLIKPTAKAAAAEKAKVERVVNDPAAIAAGVTRAWYDAVTKVLSGIKTAIILAAAALLVSSVAKAYPNALINFTPKALGAGGLGSVWVYLNTHFTHWQLFVVGNWLAFTSAFWLMGVAFGILDYSRPSGLTPFRMQQDRYPSWGEYKRAACLSLTSNVIFFFLFWGVYYLIPSYAPGTFADDVPGLAELLVQVLYSGAVAEGMFFLSHALLHTPYLFREVHSVHHQFMTPFSLCAVASHPVEAIFGNFMLFVGPFFCNSHIMFWLPATFGGAVLTCYNHSGYQFPIPIPGYVGPNYFHDYHHSHVPGPEGFQNYGVLGFLDTFFRTNSFYENCSWQAKVDKGYATPDMPVDRFIAQQGPTEEGKAEVAAFVLGTPAPKEIPEPYMCSLCPL